MADDLPEALRRTIFADLVQTQDEGVAVRDSRDMVGRKHGLSADEVCRVEREGLDHQWPPLT
jgi:hypothetical protein